MEAGRLFSGSCRPAAANAAELKAQITGGQNPARSPVKYPHASPNPHGLLGLQLRLQKLGFAAGAS